MKLRLFFLFFLAVLSAQAQTWVPMAKGIECFYSGTSVRQLLVDQTSNTLYISGIFAQDGNCNLMNGIAHWDGSHWNSLGDVNEGNTYKKGICIYQSDLYACGNFYNINPEEYMAKLSGSIWDTIAKSPNTSVFCYAENGGNLYLGGGFDRLGNDSTFLLGKYDGSQFSGLTPYYGPQGGASLQAMAFYHDTLYVGGYFHMLPHKLIGSFAKYDGSDLQLVSAEFANNGANCAIQAMAVYNDELYLGGYFTQTNGYAGNYIMKYDGSTFSDVGGGMNERVTSLRVYNGELYAGGAFTEAGSVISHHVAKWNGVSWISLSTDTISGVYPVVYDLEIFKDSLVIGGSFNSINGDTLMRRIAKYGSALTGIKEEQEPTIIQVYPNPGNGKIKLDFNLSAASGVSLRVFSSLGQVVFEKELGTRSGQLTEDLDISNQPPGIYFIALITDFGQSGTRFIKQ